MSVLRPIVGGTTDCSRDQTLPRLSLYPSWGHGCVGFRLACNSVPQLIRFNVFETISDPAAYLQIGGPLVQPAPAFEGPRAHPPAACQLNLVEMMRVTAAIGNQGGRSCW